MNDWPTGSGGPLGAAGTPGAGLNPHTPVKPPGGLHTWAPPHAQNPPRPGQPYMPAPGAPGWEPARQAPNPKRRKALWITLAAGAAVVVTVAIVLVLTLAGGGPGNGGAASAGDAVKGYLAALARGDAEVALSYGVDQPASKQFLTNEILKKQIAQWPISNIRILSDDSSGLGMGRVHVVANFGDTNSDTTLYVKKDHGSWKLDAAAIKLDGQHFATSGNAAAKTMTFFGKPVADGTVYVFPGWIDIGSTNPYLTVSAKPVLLDQLPLSGGAWMSPEIALSDTGKAAVKDSFNAAMAACQHSNLLTPPGCPVQLDSYDTRTLVDGTVSWGPPDTSAMDFSRFDPYRLTVHFSGKVTVPITAATRKGGTETATASQFLYGAADMAKTPPALTFD